MRVHPASRQILTASLQQWRSLHAVKLFDTDRSAVAHETQLALALTLRALEHGNEAAKQYVASVRSKGAS
jgi:hypothetical protein